MSGYEEPRTGSRYCDIPTVDLFEWGNGCEEWLESGMPLENVVASAMQSGDPDLLNEAFMLVIENGVVPADCGDGTEEDRVEDWVRTCPVDWQAYAPHFCSLLERYFVQYRWRRHTIISTAWTWFEFLEHKVPDSFYERVGNHVFHKTEKLDTALYGDPKLIQFEDCKYAAKCFEKLGNQAKVLEVFYLLARVGAMDSWYGSFTRKELQDIYALIRPESQGVNTTGEQLQSSDGFA